MVPLVGKTITSATHLEKQKENSCNARIAWSKNFKAFGFWLRNNPFSKSISQSRLPVAKKTPVHGAIVLACDVRCLSCSLGTTATAIFDDPLVILQNLETEIRYSNQHLQGFIPTFIHQSCQSINLPRNSLKATHQSICEFASTAFTLIGYQGISRWGPHAHATWCSRLFPMVWGWQGTPKKSWQLQITGRTKMLGFFGDNFHDVVMSAFVDLCQGILRQENGYKQGSKSHGKRKQPLKRSFVQNFH